MTQQINIRHIIDKVTAYNPNANVELMGKAYWYLKKVYNDQVRSSGEPYLNHCLEVANILANMRLDSKSLTAGLLHDVIQFEGAKKDEVKQLFGTEIFNIISGVLKLKMLSFDTSKAKQAECIRKMLLAMSNDLRIIFIKLAEQLHNMRQAKYLKNKAKINKISKESLDIYAPIASRLGIFKVKKEMEDIAFLHLWPAEFEKIKKLARKGRKEHDIFIEEIKSFITKKLDEYNFQCKVLGRYKHLYSIYMKMQTQKLKFEDIYDILAFRIILETIPQCYEVLGLVHSLWKPIDNKFKDYIAKPKPNMYKALHTTVIGPHSERLEIQIRTWEMDYIAKSGIAAHWSYKEGQKKADKNIRETYAWIQDLVEKQEKIKDPEEFIENFRVDLFPDEVYILTPLGEIKTLPKGSTPVDFGFMVHTEVGSRCAGAKVNGKMVPLKYELKTGDAVEIITNNKQRPSKDWLRFVKTAKARSKIKQWIKIQDKKRSIHLGKTMCEKGFRKHRLNFLSLMKSKELADAVEHFGYKTLDDLIAGVGYGKLTPLQIIRKIERNKQPDKDKKEDTEITEIPSHPRQKKSTSGVVVEGVDDVLIKFGKCCQPVPGDPITGYITRGYGVTVHRKSCSNALNMNEERRIDVVWRSSGEEEYSVKFRVRSNDRLGLLADLSADINKNEANIVSAGSHTREDQSVDSFFTIYVKNRSHLRQVMASLKKIHHVLDVERIG